MKGGLRAGDGGTEVAVVLGAYIIDMPFRVLYNFRSEVSSVHIFQTTLVDGFLHPFTIDWLMNRG